MKTQTNKTPQIGWDGRPLPKKQSHLDCFSSSASVASDSPNITTRQAKRSKTNARVTQYVNADNKLMFCVSVVNEGFVPHADEGRVLGFYGNAKDAQFRASVYNNEGI